MSSGCVGVNEENSFSFASIANIVLFWCLVIEQNLRIKFLIKLSRSIKVAEHVYRFVQSVLFNLCNMIIDFDCFIAMVWSFRARSNKFDDSSYDYVF